MADSPGKRRVILVHGTWGRAFFPNATEMFPDSENDVQEEDDKARWFEPASWFRSRLVDWMRQFRTNRGLRVVRR